MLDIALQAATGLAQLLQFRGNCVTATTTAAEEAATERLMDAGAQLAKAGEAVAEFLKLAKITAAAGRRGKVDLN